jgi:coiled-coil and C2 domain-containing protein 2A
MSAESGAVILRGQKWVETLKGMGLSRRRVLLMATPTNGKPFLLCRMVKPQPPPHDFTEPLRMLRFVSLIPNDSDASIYETERDVWNTSDQFLDMNSGDEEEHAVLLCNMLKHRGIDAYVVLGYDLLNGTTAFVLTRVAGKQTLYDPLTGSYWAAGDRFCSLHNVGIVFNDHNVWANIQEKCEPYRVDWNFHDTKKWQPFFGPDFAMPPLESPQPDVLVYKPEDDAGARNLERQLDHEIKNQVEEWREHQRTPWNPDIGDRLLESLDECERACRDDPLARTQMAADKIRNGFSNYRMTGAPFCMTFTGKKGIIDEVKLRGVWRTEAAEVDFALAVRVAPYPNALLVTWIILAALEYIPQGRPAI